MKQQKLRRQVQTILSTLLLLCIWFSKSKPLVISAYLVLAYSFLSTFNYIKEKEERNEAEVEDKFWVQTITFILMQLGSFAALVILTWYVFEKKINW